VEYRFEHHNLIHQFVYNENVENCLEKLEAILASHGELLSSPLHRVQELLMSKRLNAAIPSMNSLIFDIDLTGYGSKGNIRFVPLEKLQFSHNDAKLLVTRNHLSPDQIAKVK
jgi:hypothetical protein